MKKLLLGVLISGSLMGCSTFQYDLEETEKASSINLVNKSSAERGYGYAQNMEQKNVWVKGQSQRIHSKNINHYARGIMQELLSNLQYVGAATPVAVADFVYLDSDFTSSNLIGQQLSEALSHEVHKLGIPVVDYKLTDFIRVSPNGDLALSKDYLELSGDIPIRYILTGTLVEDRNTTIVNARIVGIESKAIVGSAQSVIPNRIIMDLKSSKFNDGLIAN